MEIIEKISSSQQHEAGAWNSQDIEKYVFRNKTGKLIEACLFTHYKDGKFVKKAIEVATSYGCPMKCGFCASGSIHDYSVLAPEEVMWIIDFFYKEYQLGSGKDVCLSLTGTGEMLFTIETIKKVILECKKHFPQMVYLVSSVSINTKLIDELEELSKDVYFRMVQLTYIARQPNTIIKGYKTGDALENILTSVKKSTIPNFRINYIMINNFNDSERDMNDFLQAIIPLKERLIIHISTINETNVSKNNQLQGVCREKMEEFLLKLSSSGIKAYIFKPATNNNMNCGQLVSEKYNV